MYGWIWDHLPGPIVVKAVEFLLLMAGIVWLLWFKVFPWAEPLLPFDDVTVGSETPSGGQQP